MKHPTVVVQSDLNCQVNSRALPAESVQFLIQEIVKHAILLTLAMMPDGSLKVGAAEM